MRFRPIDLSAFPPERERELKRIYRFSLFKTMRYRSNLWLHHARVLWIVEALLSAAQKSMQISPEKARALALVHDDAELVTGDVQAGHRAQMTKAQVAKLDQDEESAIRGLAARSPKLVHGYDYEELLLSMLHKDSPEAQLVSYADKVDAYCETLHEIFGGNLTLMTSFAFYARALGQFSYKYPQLKELIERSGAPFTGLDISSPMKKGEQITTKTYSRFFKPHTAKMLVIPIIRFPHYDAWRAMILKKKDKTMTAWLLGK